MDQPPLIPRLMQFALGFCAFVSACLFAWQGVPSSTKTFIVFAGLVALCVHTWGQGWRTFLLGVSLGVAAGGLAILALALSCGGAFR